MGLDTVELVMEVEEAFDVSIPDEEAEKLRTAGDLYYWIVGRLRAEAGPLPQRRLLPTPSGLDASMGNRMFKIRPTSRPPDEVTEELDFVRDLA